MVENTRSIPALDGTRTCKIIRTSLNFDDNFPRAIWLLINFKGSTPSIPSNFCLIASLSSPINSNTAPCDNGNLTLTQPWPRESFMIAVLCFLKPLSFSTTAKLLRQIFPNFCAISNSSFVRLHFINCFTHWSKEVNVVRYFIKNCSVFDGFSDIFRIVDDARTGELLTSDQASTERVTLAPDKNSHALVVISSCTASSRGPKSF